ITAGQPRGRPASKRRSALSAGSPVRERGAAIGTALLSYVTMPNFAPQHKRRARKHPDILHFISPLALGAPAEDHGSPVRCNGIACGQRAMRVVNAHPAHM